MPKPPPLKELWKSEKIPTPDEVDEWVEKLAKGQGVANFLPRLVLAYRRLYHDKRDELLSRLGGYDRRRR